MSFNYPTFYICRHSAASNMFWNFQFKGAVSLLEEVHRKSESTKIYRTLSCYFPKILGLSRHQHQIKYMAFCFLLGDNVSLKSNGMCCLTYSACILHQHIKDTLNFADPPIFTPFFRKVQTTRQQVLHFHSAT